MKHFLITSALELHPEHVPLSIEQRHHGVGRREALVQRERDVQVLELLRHHELRHAVVATQLFIGDEAEQNYYSIYVFTYFS